MVGQWEVNRTDSFSVVNGWKLSYNNIHLRRENGKSQAIPSAVSVHLYIQLVESTVLDDFLFVCMDICL